MKMLWLIWKLAELCVAIDVSVSVGWF